MKRRLTPRREMIEAINIQLRGLRDSFTNRIGPNKGKITHREILWEIRRLEDAITVIKSTEQKKGTK
jgi:hypothetical protein